MTRLTIVAGLVLALAGCTPAPAEPEGTAPSPSPTVVETGEPEAPAAAEGGCPADLVESISAEVAPTAITQAPTADALPQGVVVDDEPTCVLSYGVLSGSARQLFFVGADGAAWDAFAAAMDSAGFEAEGATYGAVADGIVGSTWNLDGNADRASETTIVNAGWVAGPQVADAPADAAVLGSSYLVATVEECPCEQAQ